MDWIFAMSDSRRSISGFWYEKLLKNHHTPMKTTLMTASQSMTSVTMLALASNFHTCRKPFKRALKRGRGKGLQVLGGIKVQVIICRGAGALDAARCPPVLGADRLGEPACLQSRAAWKLDPFSEQGIHFGPAYKAAH